MPLTLTPAQDALFLDIDGTLLDIAPTAQAVVVPETLVADLAVLAERLDGALALISGRMIHEIDALFAPLCLPCAGAHGAEWRLSSGGAVETASRLSDFLRDDIAAAFAKEDGVFVEDKIYSIAIHYRQAPLLGTKIEETLARLVVPYSETVTLLPGRKVAEIVQKEADKGGALHRFMQQAPFAGRRPIFFGDDVTDLAAVSVCRALGGAAFMVGRGDGGDETFASPAAVRDWVRRMVVAQ